MSTNIFIISILLVVDKKGMEMDNNTTGRIIIVVSVNEKQFCNAKRLFYFLINLMAQ